MTLQSWNKQKKAHFKAIRILFHFVKKKKIGHFKVYNSVTFNTFTMFMSGKFHGQRNLEGCSPSDCRVRHYLTTEHNIVQTPPCYCSRNFSSPQEESLYNLNLLQHHSSKALILRCSGFFRVQLSHPHMITRKTIALTRWTFVDKVMSLLLCCLGWS